MKKFILFVAIVCIIGWFADHTVRSPYDLPPPDMQQIAKEVDADWDGPHGQRVRDDCAASLDLKSAPKYEVDYV